jgi:membrane fusion protein (multidrug efflux system)
VREAQAKLIQAAAQLGVSDSFNKSPKQMVADFYKRDPQGDIDRIYAKLLQEAPMVKQSEAKLAQAQRNLDQAKLSLRYCDVVAEIDGAVTRRSVNPGNNVVAGQSLMAVRSLNEIWVDANFKETQLSKLRIGQSVDLEVDMYGSRQKFHGRISGFTMGTGSTLALLSAENATGNFVKVVQRLPVRIEILGPVAALYRPVCHAFRPRQRRAQRARRRKPASTVSTELRHERVGDDTVNTGAISLPLARER